MKEKSEKRCWRCVDGIIPDRRNEICEKCSAEIMEKCRLDSVSPSLSALIKAGMA